MRAVKIIFYSSFTLAMLFLILTTILSIVARSAQLNMRHTTAMCYALFVGSGFSVVTVLLGIIHELCAKVNVNKVWILWVIVFVSTFLVWMLAIDTMNLLPLQID